MMQETEALLILKHIPLLSYRNVKALLDRFGSAVQILQTPAEAITSLFKDGGKCATAIAGWEAIASWREDLKLAARLGASLISYKDPAYPVALRELADFPLLLYVMGELLPEDNHAIGVVGTRMCTLYGKEMAHKLGEELGRAGITVVSGLARGIDTAAHNGALKGGRTIAVLGSGLAEIYPRENNGLSRQIANKGAIISEFPMQATPQKHHFPKRNRLVSALSKGVLLIEAPLNSGAMITMDYAFAQGKLRFVLPGRADSENFQGNHALLKSQKAHLVENVQDMLSLLQPGAKEIFSINNRPPRIDLDPEEQLLIAALSSEEACIEDIAQRTRLPMNKLNSLLMALVLKKAVREFPGRLYKKVV